MSTIPFSKGACLLLLLVGLLLVPGLAWTEEEGLTVDQAVAAALEGNDDLAQAAITLAAKKRAAQLAWNGALPSLSAQAGLAKSGASDSLALSGGLALSLSLGADYAEGFSVASLAYEAQAISYEAAKSSLELKVRKAFAAVLLDEAKLKLARQNIARYEESLARTEAKYRAGLASELDYLTAKVDLAALRPKALTYEASLRNDADSLLLLLGRGPDSSLSLTGSLDLPEARVKAVLEAAAAQPVSRNLSVLAAEASHSLAVATRAKTVSSVYLPSLSVSGSLGPTLSLASASSLEWSGSLSATLSLPLSPYVPGSSGRESVASADDSVALAAKALVSARKATEVARISAARTVETYLSALAAQGLTVELSQKAYDAAKAAYDKGLESLSDLSSAAASLESANLELLSSSYSLYTAILDLESETGLALDTLGRNPR